MSPLAQNIDISRFSPLSKEDFILKILVELFQSQMLFVFKQIPRSFALLEVVLLNDIDVLKLHVFFFFISLAF